MIISNGRKFIIVYDAGPTIRIVKERIVLNKGHPYLEHYCDRPRWHKNHNPLPKRGYLVDVFKQFNAGAR